MERAGKVLTDIVTNVANMTGPIKQVTNSIQEQENGIEFHGIGPKFYVQHYNAILIQIMSIFPKGSTILVHHHST